MKLNQIQLSINAIGKSVSALALNLILIVGVILGVSSLSLLLAKPLPVDASSAVMAQVNYSRKNLDRQPDETYSNDSENLIENARDQLQETADTVREKLNLNEPISPSTKDFAEDVKEKVLHPLSGDKDLVDNQSNWKYRD